MIANVIQPVVFESVGTGDWPRIGLGILPLNHSYGLVTTHAMFYRGDTTVTHGSFDIQLMLESIQKHRIERLYLVSKQLIGLCMIRMRETCELIIDA